MKQRKQQTKVQYQLRRIRTRKFEQVDEFTYLEIEVSVKQKPGKEEICQES